MARSNLMRGLAWDAVGWVVVLGTVAALAALALVVAAVDCGARLVGR
jgi:hypothetical protein